MLQIYYKTMKNVIKTNTNIYLFITYKAKTNKPQTTRPGQVPV